MDLHLAIFRIETSGGQPLLESYPPQLSATYPIPILVALHIAWSLISIVAFVAYLIVVLGRLVIHRMLVVFLVVALVMVLVVMGVNLVPIVVVLQWSLNYLLAWLVDLLVFVGRLVVHRMLVVFVVVVLVVL